MKKIIAVGISSLLLLTGCGESEQAAAKTTAPAESEEPELETIDENDEISEALDDAKDAVSVLTEGSYEDIYNEYSKKLTDATPGLIDEYHAEAASNTNGIDGLAEIANAKVEKLAEIETEGTEKMAQFMYTGGSGKYEEYESWAGKLYDVYDAEGQKIYSEYMTSVTG